MFIAHANPKHFMKHVYMFKNSLAALFAFFLVLPFGNAQNDTKPQPNALLWEISGNGLKKRSYLFGTYHLLTNKFVDSFAVIGNRFSNAEALVCEASFDKTAMKELDKAMVLNGTTLDKVMQPADYKIVADKVKQLLGVGMEHFNNYKPMTVLLLLY